MSPNKKPVYLDLFGNFFTTTCLLMFNLQKKKVNLTHSAGLHLFHLQATPVITVNYVFWGRFLLNGSEATQKRRGLSIASLHHHHRPPWDLPDPILRTRSTPSRSAPGGLAKHPISGGEKRLVSLARVIPASQKKNWVWVWLTIGCSSLSSFGEFSATFWLLNHKPWMNVKGTLCPPYNSTNAWIVKVSGLLL